MCIFSAKVKSVSDTNIFARLSKGQQYLVYEMNLSTANEMAMILPLPVDHPQDANVSLIDLSDYPLFSRIWKSVLRCFVEALLRQCQARRSTCFR